MTRADRDVAYDKWLGELTIATLEDRLRALGVEKVVMKKLSGNQDNSQNQFYWQGNLNENPLPLGDFEEFESRSAKTGTVEIGYKAKIDLEWLTPTGTNPAPRAQLIHYPQYPETRLGSLLDGAVEAPRSVIASRRVSVPGRLLLLGIAGRKVIAVALPPQSPAANALKNLFGESVFAMWAITPQAEPISADELLAELHAVFVMCPVRGCTIRSGQVVENSNPNAPGTTLETVLGVKPNALDEPDFHGWELKAHSDSKITLMTPAPTGGAIRTEAAEDFMRKFGWLRPNGQRWDFNGAHRANHDPGGKATTRLNLTPSDVQLVHKETGEVAMSWRVADLLTHWAQKHSRAAYVRRSGSAAGGLTYGPFVQLGQGVDWNWFRQALNNGTIALDPAYNMVAGARSMRKARAQFRCEAYQLGALYPSVTAHDLRHAKLSRKLAEDNMRAGGYTLPDWVSL